MKDILVVAKLKEGKFEKFMGFMTSEEGMNERRKIAFLDGSNPVSKPIFDEVMESYEIFEINKV